jgi:hypothetical protein
MAMDNPDYPFAAQGNRLRILRLAERIPTGAAFAVRLDWPQSGYSQFETGKRQIPLPKVQALPKQIPGFDPQWLWNGDKRGLGFDLRQRIEAVERSEAEKAEAKKASGASDECLTGSTER